MGGRERDAYLRCLGRVWPVDAAVAMVAGEVLTVVPEPPSPVRRSHRLVETRASRVSRWRFEVMIAATAW